MEAAKKEAESPGGADPDMDVDNMAEDDDEMAAMMGFGGFETTKGKHVNGNEDAGATDIKKQRTWRQYMNRKGGFNRPLDKIT